MLFSATKKHVGPLTFDFLVDDDHGEDHRVIRVSDGSGWELDSPNFGRDDEAFDNHFCWALLVGRARLKQIHDELYEKFLHVVTKRGGSEQGASLAFNYTPGERYAHP